jgi:NAD(P)-dependent dehydrogenase (short-subunit alcohol dehydrogenase family)
MPCRATDEFAIPSLSDSGFGTSIELAKHGARVYIASRSATKFNDAKRVILSEFPKADVRFLTLDLTDLDSVQAAAEKFTK